MRFSAVQHDKRVSEFLVGRIGLVMLLGFTLRELHGTDFDPPLLPTYLGG